MANNNLFMLSFGKRRLIMYVHKVVYDNFKIVRNITKKSIYILLFIKIIQGFIPVINLIILQKLINSVQNSLGVENASAKIVIMFLVLQFTLTVSMSVLSKVKQYLESKVQSDIELEIKTNIAYKMFRVKYEKLESFSYQNLIQRTQGDMGYQIFQPLNQALELISTFITVVTVSLFLFQFHWLFVLIISIAAIPIVIIQSKFGADRYHLLKFQTPLAREQHYLFDIFTDRHHNKEIRLTNAQNYLIDKWKKIFNKNRLEILNQEAKQQKHLVGLDALSGFSYLVSTGYLIWMIMQKTVRVGDFVSIVESLQVLQSSLVSLATTYSSLKETTFYLRDLNQLLEMEEESILKNEDFPSLLQEGIKISDFSFRYPESESEVLKSISMNIPKNSSLVIVGENGSGKSTLVKCLAGLYSIEQEKVYYDEVDASTIKTHEFSKNLSIVHQDFIRYELSLEENVLLGGIEFSGNKNKGVEDLLEKVEATNIKESSKW